VPGHGFARFEGEAADKGGAAMVEDLFAHGSCRCYRTRIKYRLSIKCVKGCCDSATLCQAERGKIFLQHNARLQQVPSIL
jgi:hypothetical protein